MPGVALSHAGWRMEDGIRKKEVQLKARIVCKGIEVDRHKNAALDDVREGVLRLVMKEQQPLAHVAWHIVQVLKKALVNNAIAIRINDELVWQDFEDEDTDDIGKLGRIIEKSDARNVKLFASDDTGDVMHFVQVALDEVAGMIDLTIAVESEIQTVADGETLEDFADDVERLLDEEFIEDCFDDFEELVGIISRGIGSIFGNHECTIEKSSLVVPMPEDLSEAFDSDDEEIKTIYPPPYYDVFGISPPRLTFEDLYFRYLLAEYAFEEMPDTDLVHAVGAEVDFEAIADEVSVLEEDWFTN
jgi:hypothetical protein